MRIRFLTATRVLISLAVLAVGCVACQGAQAAGDINTSACPNEALTGFSAALPDCRAYELATPAYTESAPVPEAASDMTLSGDGEDIAVQSLGVFADAHHDTGLGGEYYLLQRTAAGWSAEALSPPGGYFGGVEFHAELIAGAVAADSTSPALATLWGFPAQRELERVTIIDLRLPNGEFEEVGPLGFEARSRERQRLAYFAGASQNLESVVLGGYSGGFESESALWPGDETGDEQRSLYVYTGVNSAPSGPEREPELVGVENEGRLHGTPHVNDGAHLVSACGTVLGGAESEYNAVAQAGGHTSIFFTAEHSESCSAPQPSATEVLARIDGEHTVNLSEPATPANRCAALEPCELAPQAPASFQGASGDGRLVFFTSEQPLVSGAPFEGVKLYADRVEGDEVKEVRDLSSDPVAGQSPRVLGVARISEDGARVYFVAAGALTNANAEGHAPVEEAPNLYCYDTVSGELSFVATLAESDYSDWGVDERPVQATADGHFLAFVSKAPLVGAEGGTRQVFEYDAQNKTLVHVSRNQNGFAGIEGPEYQAVIPKPEGTASPTLPTSRLAIATDGAVAFQSSAELAPGALDHQQVGVYNEEAVFAQNLYLFEDGNVYLISDGHDVALHPEGGGSGVPPSEHAGVELVGIDSTATDVFFRTSDALAPDQQDSQWSLYDARSGGGFQPRGESFECGGEECREPIGAQPQTVAPLTQLTPGGGNVPLAAPSKSKPAKSLTRTHKRARALNRCKHYHNKRRRARCLARAPKASGPKASKKIGGSHR